MLVSAHLHGSKTLTSWAGQVQLNGNGPGDYASNYNASGPGSQDRARRGTVLPPTRFDYDSVSVPHQCIL
jgi:hypothetical protein